MILLIGNWQPCSQHGFYVIKRIRKRVFKISLGMRLANWPTADEIVSLFNLIYFIVTLFV